MSNDNSLKTGVELINSFFKELNENKEQYSDKEVVDVIVKLHSEGKLSNTNITNALETLRNHKINEK